MPLTIEIPETEAASIDDQARFAEVSGLAELSEFYRQLGFDAGYGRAARDQLEYSVVTAEQVLRERGTSLSGPQDARRLLYSFIARIDRRLSLFADASNAKCKEDFVEGGLGI
jgi:hypothetical protein